MSKRMNPSALLLRRLLPAVLACWFSAAAFAEEISGEELRSLDGQVQEVKSDVLSIASELSLLEERLLYPSNTQIAIFVAVADDEEFRLDAVEIEIDGELATHHIYSFNELQALQKGGVQRAYTGNVVTGDHEIRVTMAGMLENGDDFRTTESFSFSKGVRPATLGITLASPGSGRSGIDLGDW